jgi:hypothetical protein
VTVTPACAADEQVNLGNNVPQYGRERKEGGSVRTNRQLQDVKDALGFLREVKAMLSVKGEVNREVALDRVEQAMRLLEQVAERQEAVAEANAKVKKRITGYSKKR